MTAAKATSEEAVVKILASQDDLTGAEIAEATGPGGVMKVIGLGSPDDLRVRFDASEVDVLVDVLRDLRAQATRDAADTYATTPPPETCPVERQRFTAGGTVGKGDVAAVDGSTELAWTCEHMFTLNAGGSNPSEARAAVTSSTPCLCGFR